MSLTPADIDAIAARVVELLEERAPRFPRQGLVDVDAVAALLGVSHTWVYAHQAELGAVRLGGGPRPILRFDAAVVRDYVEGRRVAPAREQPTSRAGPRRGSCSVELLPVPEWASA